MTKLGEDIALARKKRLLSTVSMAKRMHVNRSTLNRVRRGDPKVSMGIYATALSILGLADGLFLLADRKNDEIGLNLEESRLPKRIQPRNSRERS